jgi:tyrosinase
MTDTGSSGRQPLGAPRRGNREARSFTSDPIPIDFAGPEHRYYRADLEIDGIDHGGASYEGRVFLNNPGATSETPLTAEAGYAGSFHIFGHGGCLGDPGHCEVTPRRDPFDFRNPHPLTPAKKKVNVTDMLRRLAESSATATVTIVPVVTATNELTDDLDVFHCTSIQFLTYN